MQGPQVAAILVGALLAVGASAGGSPAHADFGSGMEAYRAKDYATARAIFLDLAEIGDGPSQYNLGAMALRGEAAPADRGAALGWMRAASENGYQVDAAVLHRLAAQASPAELATADAVVGRYGAAALEATVLPRRPSEGRATGRLEPPRILSTGEVRYPPRALQRRQPGFVVVRFVIGSDGVPRDERTLLSVPALDDGGEAFAQEVLRVVAERRYRPALCNGRPVDSDMCLRVNFSMPGDVLELKPWLVAWVRERAQAGHPYYQYVLGVPAQASPPSTSARPTA